MVNKASEIFIGVFFICSGLMSIMGLASLGFSAFGFEGVATFLVSLVVKAFIVACVALAGILVILFSSKPKQSQD